MFIWSVIVQTFHRTIGSVHNRTIPFILYASEMFELEENRLYAYAYDSTLQAVVRKPADRPTFDASLNRDLAGIQLWCNHGA